MEQNKSISKNNKTKKAASTPKAPKKITETYLHNSALYYLERFATSTGNFRRVMTRKIDKSCRAHPDQNREKCLEMLESLIQKLTRLALLNDETYARGTAISLRRRGKSARHITGTLAAKGIDANLAQSSLDAASEETGDYEAALTHARKKKLGPWRGTKEKNEQKEMASLARAGFSYDIARKIIGLTEDYNSDFSE